MSPRRSTLPFAYVLSLASVVSLAGCKGGTDGTASTSLDPPAATDPAGDLPAFPFVAHVDQADITSGKIRFDELFILGDELFETQFNTLDGSGIQRLPDGTSHPERFSRVPPGGGRLSGPNAQACVGCHNSPFPTSAGESASNILQDPARDGAGPFNLRQPISLFGSAVPQRLAEEMTDDLLAIRDAAAASATPGGPPVTLALETKGVSFGTITAMRDGAGVLSFDLSGVDGVSPDLVVRPYGWKGNVTTLRDFTRSAAVNELGMESDETVAKDPMGRADPDGDGVEGELSVGDITAITIYIGAQPIPADTGRLVREGLEPPPPPSIAGAISRGRALFGSISCASCHIPELHVDDPVFEEPTLRGGGNFFDPDMDPVATSLDPARPFRFHLVREGESPRLLPSASGGARAMIFGDLKRHEMGSALADAQPTPVFDATGAQLSTGGVPQTVGESVFLTPELWGVGNTGPWLHDGRAASLEEAILLHGVDTPPPPGDPARSEAQEERDAFAALSPVDRAAVVEFLKSLVLVKLEEDEE